MTEMQIVLYGVMQHECVSGRGLVLSRNCPW